MKTLKQNILSYVIIIASIFIVAGLGTLFVNLGLDWFSTLQRPSQFPPDFIIPIVWTIIYGIFAVVLCIWVTRRPIKTSTLVLLILNGILNILWCLLFFTLKLTFVGLVAIIFNLIAGYLLVANIYKENKVYGYLTIIYPVWLSIATGLNLALWILN